MSLNDFVPTKSSLRKRGAEKEFESVSFVSYKKKKSSNIEENQHDSGSMSSKNSKQLNINKLRYEVIKLGTSGMDPLKKESSSVALAVALGAKPPKNKFRNYKEILEEKKNRLPGSKDQVSLSTMRKQNHRHMYVVRDKVIPAKSEKKKKGMKNFLERYGKV